MSDRQNLLCYAERDAGRCGPMRADADVRGRARMRADAYTDGREAATVAHAPRAEVLIRPCF
ncbi:hypothetical protein CK936_01200 [Streptomyces albireticuli]|uniref:Uncharacterized protein n=1 Tax=Streptomyces albireticuli TaxID=1940 RepID=A0A2A2DGM2_9ACTN|nr:hypothetical protein CK936_01200 [Streptomyces albireticuli]